MSTLQFYFLGTLDIRYDDQPLPKPPTLKSQSLLAYLTLHRHRPRSRHRLVGLFWGERPERKARHSLSTALWHIRRSLPHEELILSNPHTVQFDPHSDLWLDVEEFQFLSSSVSGYPSLKPEPVKLETERLQRAVALYRGNFLDGFYDDWIINERYRLETLFLDALARLMVGHERAGDHQAALATALRLLGHDPLREDAHRLAMRAYCRLGQRNGALEQYHRCRKVVLEELGAEPMVETSELYQAILEGQCEVGRVPSAPIPVIEPSAPPGRNPLDVVAPSRMVGREQELTFLHDCWQKAQPGHGGLVLISGEAGVGKTRLVQEFANRLRWQGVRVLWGRCYEFERALPYQPLAEALRTVLSTLTPPELSGLPAWPVAQVAHLVPEILELRPGLGSPAAPVMVEERARLFEGVARFVAELSAHRALLILLEDLQWASESTLQLLHYLARHLAHHPVLMVGTLRPEAIGLQHPLMTLRRRLTREGLAQPLRLSRLSSEAVEAMVVEMSGAGEAVVPLARRLYQETEGNPFFLLEIIKVLFDTEVVYLEEGVWRGSFAQISEGEIPLPAGVSEAIQARVHRLNDNAQEVVQWAAVLGREFDFELLNTVWGRGEEATLEALDDLLRHRLIEEVTGPLGRDYAFTHHKIQQVVYAVMLRRQRQFLHAQVGAAMERLCAPDTQEVAGELAFHFERAWGLDPTLTGKAIRYLKEASDQARQAYAHQDAIDYYRRALALLEETPPDEAREDWQLEIEVQLHEGLASVLEMTGQHDEARDAYREALTRVPKQDVIRRSHLYRRIGKSWEVPLCYEEAAQAYDLAESVLGRKPTEPDLRWWQAWIEVRVDRMWLCYWQRQVDRMAELAQKAGSAVERYGTPVQRARFFQVLLMTALQRDRFRPSEETAADARASLAASREINDPSIVAMSQFKLGFTCLCRDDLMEAEEALRTARSMAERTGDVALQTRCLAYLTVLYRKRGQIDQVRHYVCQSLEAATTAQMTMYVGYAKANLAWAAWRERDLSEAEVNGQAALDLWQQMEPHPFYWLALWPLIGVALAHQEVATAMEYVPMLLDPLQQRLPGEMATALERALEAWDQDRADAAQRYLRHAAETAASLGYL